MTVEAPQSLGDYQLLALLATGGMAEIYLAKEKGQTSDKLVVVKRIFPHLAKQQRFVDMFLDEGNIAATLNHENIVKIFESSKEDDEYFIAMEYLEGESLGYLVKQLRKDGRALPTPLAAGIVGQVCAGLHYAHTLNDKAGKPMNIVHRDVSPHNIIINYDGLVKLVDFGIAKAASKIHKTRVGTLKGKLTYISPEQYRSGAVDARSDVFSLGVVFWELLTRRRLFKRETEKDMMRATLSGSIPRVRDIQAGVSPELEEVAHKALQLKPEDRYQSAADMEKAIQQALEAIGATSEIDEIAQFVSGAFEERAQTKQRLLREIQAQPNGQEPCDVSQSEIIAPQITDGDDIEDDDGPFDEITPVDEDEDDVQCEVPTANVPNPMRLAQERQAASGRKLHPAVWAVPLGGLVILVILLLAFGDRDQAQSGQPDGEASQSSLASSQAKTGPVKPPHKNGGPPAGDSAPAAAAAGDPGKSAPPTAPTSGTPKHSLIAVRSRPPGCRVEVDGRLTDGLTPREKIALEDGMNHKVSVLCKNHHKETKEVLVSTGERITLDFAPSRIQERPRAIKAPKPVETSRPQEKQPEASRQKKEAEKSPVPVSKQVRKQRPAARPKPGFLRLDTIPWSEVYLGERKLGITPLVKEQLPAGTHVLTSINLGRQLKKSFKVTIKPGQITKLRLSLTK